MPGWYFIMIDFINLRYHWGMISWFWFHEFELWYHVLINMKSYQNVLKSSSCPVSLPFSGLEMKNVLHQFINNGPRQAVHCQAALTSLTPSPQDRLKEQPLNPAMTSLTPLLQDTSGAAATSSLGPISVHSTILFAMRGFKLVVLDRVEDTKGPARGLVSHSFATLVTWANRYGVTVASPAS